MAEAARKPDYNLAVLSKSTGRKSRVGAAWKNDDGRITIRLDLCTVIDSNPDLEITLFENSGFPTPYHKTPKASKLVSLPKPEADPDLDVKEDDLPF